MDTTNDAIIALQLQEDEAKNYAAADDAAIASILSSENGDGVDSHPGPKLKPVQHRQQERRDGKRDRGAASPHWSARAQSRQEQADRRLAARLQATSSLSRSPRERNAHSRQQQQQRAHSSQRVNRAETDGVREALRQLHAIHIRGVHDNDFPPLVRQPLDQHAHGVDVDSMDYEQLLALGARLGNVKRQGVSAQTLNALPHYKFQLDECKRNAHQCCICLEDLQSGQHVRRLPCFHVFHRDEIDNWLRSNNACPICKANVEQS